MCFQEDMWSTCFHEDMWSTCFQEDMWSTCFQQDVVHVFPRGDLAFPGQQEVGGRTGAAGTARKAQDVRLGAGLQGGKGKPRAPTEAEQAAACQSASVAARDISLNLFHVLGKVLYNKRLEVWGRRRSPTTPR